MKNYERINIVLPRELKKQVKVYCVDKEISITKLITDYFESIVSKEENLKK